MNRVLPRLSLVVGLMAIAFAVARGATALLRDSWCNPCSDSTVASDGTLTCHSAHCGTMCTVHTIYYNPEDSDNWCQCLGESGAPGCHIVMQMRGGTAYVDCSGGCDCFPGSFCDKTAGWPKKCGCAI
jgi:hypothetical protein